MNGPERHLSERMSRERLDMIAAFPDETQARQALADLRAAGFGPDQAILLRPEEPSPSAHLISPDGQIRLPTADLLSDQVVAIWIIVSTEFAVGALAGVVVGWLVALFLNAPNIGPLWFWMLILGAAGAAGGIVVGSLEWRAWKRRLDTLRQQAAIGMRFSRRSSDADIARARAILAQHGGAGIEGAGGASK
ncbi:MAG TPA: hypothetical protein VH599_06870 [Ktedonobacterales bacterium]|jgi:hypothetical protein